MHPPLDSVLLAKEAEGIRRLARALLVDTHRADDAAQEALRIAMESGPGPGLAPAAWLRGVLRNVIRRTRRTDARRLARERAAAAPDRAPDSASTERLARRKAVLEAVLVLPEALRTAIELRYFEGLPPRAIARRLGIPVETCRSRVRRGLEALRTEFDRREEGAGRRWALALAPIAFPSRGAEGWIGKGVLLMGIKTKVAVGVSVLALLGGSALWVRSVRTEEGPTPVGPPPLATADGVGTLAAAGRSLAASSNEVDAALPPGIYRLRVTGLVTDVDGHPIAGARIHAGSADRFDDLTRTPDATTGPDGRFVAERTGPDVACRVQASAPGYRNSGLTASAGMDRDVVMRLSRTLRLWLSVRGEESDLPIEGAEVVLVTADEGSQSIERTRTDAAGLASVEDPGVRALGFVGAGLIRVSAPSRAAERIQLGRLVPGTTTRDRPHRIAMRPAAPLPFRVVSATGEPVANASVFGWTAGHAGNVGGGTMLRAVEGGAIPLGPVDSDAAGIASLDVGSDRWYVFATRGDDAALRTGQREPKAPIELRLSPAITVEGTVVGEGGTLVPGADVGVHWYAWMRTPQGDPVPDMLPEVRARFRARTDASGRFRLQRLPRPPAPGTLFVEATTDGAGLGSPRSGSAPVEASADATSANVRIVLPRVGETLSFRVHTSTGAPIPGALVHFPWYPAARTGPSGIASLDVFQPDAKRPLYVEAPGFATRRVTLGAERPAGAVDIVLDPEAVLELTVRAPGGRPVPGAYVAIVADGTDDEVALAFRDRTPPWSARFTDADGRARIEGLPRTPVRIAAEFLDTGVAGIEERERNRRELRLDIPGPTEIVLPRAPFDPATGSVVEGEIVGADGLPVSETYSAALQSRGYNFHATATGRRFRFEGIPAGRWQLQVCLADSRIPLLADVVIAPGRDVTGLRITRTNPGRISGRVVARDANGLPGLPLLAIDTRGLGLVRGATTSTTDGTFRFDELPPGPYRIVLRAPEAGRLPFVALSVPSVEVDADADARIEIRADPAARIVLMCDDPRVRPRPKTSPSGILDSEDAATNVVLTWPDGHSETSFGLYPGRNETPWALAPGRYGLRVQRFEEFVGEVLVDRTGDVEVQVKFGPPIPSPR